VIPYIIAALAIILVGLIVLNNAIKRAPFGYEDECGFHEGSVPQEAMVFDADFHTAATGPIARPLKEGFRTRRFLGEALRKSVGHGT
jgi:hypothetical protein